MQPLCFWESQGASGDCHLTNLPWHLDCPGIVARTVGLEKHCCGLGVPGYPRARYVGSRSMQTLHPAHREWESTVDEPRTGVCTPHSSTLASMPSPTWPSDTLGLSNPPPSCIPFSGSSLIFSTQGQRDLSVIGLLLFGVLASFSLKSHLFPIQRMGLLRGGLPGVPECEQRVTPYHLGLHTIFLLL